MKKSMFLAAAFSISGAGAAFAQPGPALLAEGPGFKDLALASGALILVLAALIAALKGLQRLGRGRLGRGRGGLFEARGFYPLDNRKYLAAVAVDGRLLIVGVTPDRLVPLGSWREAREADGAGEDGAADENFSFQPPAEDDPLDISVVEESSAK